MMMCGSLAKIAINGPFENRTLTCEKKKRKMNEIIQNLYPMGGPVTVKMAQVAQVARLS